MNIEQSATKHIPSPIKPPDSHKAGGDFQGFVSAFEENKSFAPASAILEGQKQANNILNFIKVAAFWVARGLSLPWELIFRREIGERYITKPVIGSAIGVFVVLHFVKIIPLWLAACLAATLLVLLNLHGWARARAYRRGDYWHSYSAGRSILEFEHAQRKLEAILGPINTVRASTLFYEPIIPLLISFFLLPYKQAFEVGQLSEIKTEHFLLSLYFVSVAFAIFAYQSYCAAVLRGQLLDHLDAELLVSVRQQPPLNSDGKGNFSIQPRKGVAVVSGGFKRPWGSAPTPAPVTPVSAATPAENQAPPAPTAPQSAPAAIPAQPKPTPQPPEHEQRPPAQSFSAPTAPFVAGHAPQEPDFQAPAIEPPPTYSRSPRGNKTKATEGTPDAKDEPDPASSASFAVRAPVNVPFSQAEHFPRRSIWQRIPAPAFPLLVCKKAIRGFVYVSYFLDYHRLHVFGALALGLIIWAIWYFTRS